MVRDAFYLYVPFWFLFFLLSLFLFSRNSNRKAFFYDFEWLYECCSSIWLQQPKSNFKMFFFLCCSALVWLISSLYDLYAVNRAHWKQWEHFSEAKHKPFRLSDGFILCRSFVYRFRLLPCHGYFFPVDLFSVKSYAPSRFCYACNSAFFSNFFISGENDDSKNTHGCKVFSKQIKMRFIW